MASPNRIASLARLPLDAAALTGEIRRINPRLFAAQPLPAGGAGKEVSVSAKDLAVLVRITALAACGLADASQREARVLWRSGGSDLLLQPGALRTQLADGVIALSLPVQCDQSGDALIHSSFFVGSRARPAGLLATTDERPRGPAAVVDVWGERLQAFAWRVLLELVTHIAAEAGRDADGAPLIPASLTALPAGISVLPMARHAFDRTT
ncbi:MAG: hypothetical protein ABI574_08485 [Burkholderiales bacterium]